MRLKLAELQEANSKAQRIKKEKLSNENWQKIDRVLYHHGLLFILKAICTKLISRHYNNALAGHFKIEKTQELMARKYY